MEFFNCKEARKVLGVDNITLFPILGLVNFQEAKGAYNARNDTLEMNHPMMPNDSKERINALTKLIEAINGGKENMVATQTWLHEKVNKMGGYTPIELMQIKGNIGVTAIEKLTEIISSRR